MKTIEGNLRDQSIFEAIRLVYRERGSGVLEIGQDDTLRKFYFVAGELHLPGGHALAQRVAELTAGAGDDDESRVLSPDALDQLRAIVARIVAVMTDWQEGEFTFEPDLKLLPSDLVGPLPTAHLVMEGAVLGLDENAMLLRLGGEEALLVADGESVLLERLNDFDPGEMFLLSRAETPIALGELLKQVPGERIDTLRMLCRLQSLDLIEVASSQHPVGPDTEKVRLIDSMVERFLERIEQRLKNDPVELDPDEHRHKIAELVGTVGSMTHYELLDVGFHDTEQRVHEAYDQLARAVHPVHAAAIGFEGREETMRLLFERATVAYLTLADPERRVEYNQGAGIDANTMPSGNQRNQEQREVAEANFRRALDLVENEEFHFALELTRQAIRADPRAEYFALLGRIQAQNPMWLEQASESYRQALRRDPQNGDFRVAMGQLMEQAGELHRARVHYRAALQLAPDNADAIDGLSRLSSGKEAPPPSEPTPSSGTMRQAPVPPPQRQGLLARIRRLWS